jgi:hypothetical protein
MNSLNIYLLKAENNDEQETKLVTVPEISGSHCGEYEDDCLLGYRAM